MVSCSRLSPWAMHSNFFTTLVVIENLTLEGANLLPNVIEIEARNYFKVSPYANIKDVSKHSFMVSFSQVQADLKDVAFCTYILVK